ncbi:sensor histidine kinase [Kitasatospora sp. NPDC058201]|uniref:sensor histidine kinase n=1 Tax=Streptomycetaceae TaxID=2062 RepID=UPI002E764AB0|nr:histidine kinase [Streptomyces sp. BE303]MED7948700.1 histidine kinase [Streptomyces sp. BE303]
MGVVNPVRRWRGFSKPQRSELYLRWSLYLMALAPLPAALLSSTSAPETRHYPASVRVSLVVGLALVLVTLRAYRTSLDHYLKRPADHPRWLLITGAVAVAGSWAVMLIGPRTGDGPDGAPFTASIVIAMLFSSFGPAAVGLAPRTAALAGLGALLAVAPAIMLAGVDLATTCGMLVFTASAMTFMGCSCRSFAWLQSVVWELDSAREAQAQLAVAEERLRFSRDLHDVMGRNLTTIALKSELAFQLARRGRPEAADQMAEVQRIAQESQREVRDVIRGYRTADLHAEAIGARAVLRSADVACEIDLGEHAHELPAPVQSVLGWVIREATTNVLRHSEAARCSIRLRREDDRALLELENDGVPAVPLPSQGGGTGLGGLRERLAVHDGELTLPVAAPGSFRLLASVPI